MAFHGWPEAALEFLEGLELDNSKSYWLDHKAVYTEAVVGPMNELCAELAEEFGASKLFRPYRDVRFSKDKTPYKTECSARLEGGGYVQFSTAGLGVGAGYYMVHPPHLERLRAAILDDKTGAEVQLILDQIRADGGDIMSYDTLKSAPRGVPKDHPRIELLRHKGLACWWLIEPGEWLATSEAATVVVDRLRKSQPLLTWLDTNVGPEASS